MSMRVDRHLPPSERDAIRRAVAETELETSAEIVVYVVEGSDDYAEAVWRASVIFALVAGLLTGLWTRFDLARDPARYEVDSLGFLWVVAASGVVGALLALGIPGLRRRFVPRSRRLQRVRERAERAFGQEGIASTAGRTGVLLLVSLFERIVCVVPDRAVGAAIAESEWNAITDRIAAEIGAGDLGAAIRRGLRDCGELLRAHGLTRAGDDANELDDRVRLE